MDAGKTLDPVSLSGKLLIAFKIHLDFPRIARNRLRNLTGEPRFQPFDADFLNSRIWMSNPIMAMADLI